MTALATANNLPPEPGQPLDLDTLNAVFEKQQPAQVVDWAARQFGDGLVMSSSFGAESAMLLHMTTQVLPRVRVIFVDTGYLFPETHTFMEQLRRRLDLNVWAYRTRNDPFAYLKPTAEAARTGPRTWTPAAPPNRKNRWNGPSGDPPPAPGLAG